MIRGTILFATALVAIIAYAWFGSALRAAEQCVRYDILVRVLEANGFTVHPPIILKGLEAEMLMITERDGVVLASSVVRGCVLKGAISLGRVPEPA